jgi:hypothetical protein
MTVEENTDISLRLFTVFVTNFGKITKYLSFIIDAGNDFPGSGRII